MKIKMKLFGTLVLILCCCILVGTTLASGTAETENLKAVFSWSEDNSSWSNAKENAASVFNSDAWEPGYTEMRYFNVKNNGEYDFTYQLQAVPEGQFSTLAEVIDVFYLIAPEKTYADRDEFLTTAVYAGTLSELTNGIIAEGALQKGANETVAVALRMQENAGNVYKGVALGEFSLVFIAGTDELP